MTDKTTRRFFLGRAAGATAGALAVLGLGGAVKAKAGLVRTSDLRFLGQYVGKTVRLSGYAVGCTFRDCTITAETGVHLINCALVNCRFPEAFDRLTMERCALRDCDGIMLAGDIRIIGNTFVGTGKTALCWEHASGGLITRNVVSSSANGLPLGAFS